MAEIFLENAALADLTGPVQKTDKIASYRPADGPELQRMSAELVKQFADGFQTTVASDADFTLTPFTSSDSIRHTGTLTADRAVTLATAGAYSGARFLVTRTGGGAFGLNVGTGPLKALATDEWGLFRYDGAAWYLEAFGSLAAGGAIPAKATVGELRSSAAGDKYVAPEAIESASAFVTLTDGANIAVDWDSGINFDVTLAGNRTLDNPTNGQIGTWRTVIVKQDATGSRTLAFGANYKFPGGTAPTLTTAASAEDVLSILCQSASRFLVFSALDLK